MLVLSPQPVAAFDMSTVEPLRICDTVFDTFSPRTPDFAFFFDNKISERHMPVSTPDSFSSSMTAMEGGVDPKMLSYPGQTQGESKQPKKTLKRKASSDVDDETIERPSKRLSYTGYPAPDYRNTPVLPGLVQAGSRSSLPSMSQTGYNYRPENTSYSTDRSVYSSTPYSEGSEFLTATHPSPMPVNADRAWTLSPAMLASAAPYNTTPITGGYATSSSTNFVAPSRRSTETINGYTFPPIFSTANSSSNLPSLSSAAGGEKPVPVKPPSAKPRCWDHGCNGRTFSTFSNLLRHQRERSGVAQKTFCPRCGAEFTRSTARNMHLQNAKCKARRHSSYQ